MKHINGPVALCKRGDGRKFSDVLDIDGNYVAYEIDSGHAADITLAVNAYDKLVAERDDLRTQRDALQKAQSRQADLILETERQLVQARRENEALVQACEAWKRWYDGEGIPERDGIIDLTEAALALVRGEADNE